MSSKSHWLPYVLHDERSIIRFMRSSMRMSPKETLIAILKENGGQMLYGKLTREVKKCNRTFDSHTANSVIMQLWAEKKLNISNGNVILVASET